MKTKQGVDLTQLSADQEKQVLHQTVGEAVARWGNVEISFAMLFAMKLRGDRMDANSLVVFYAIENFRSKIQVMDALFAAPLIPKALKAKWEILAKQLTERAKKRNEIAHHNILVSGEAKPGRRALIVPPLLGPLHFERFESGKKPGMGIKDVEAAISEFSQVITATDMLCAEIDEARKMPQSKD